MRRSSERIDLHDAPSGRGWAFGPLPPPPAHPAKTKTVALAAAPTIVFVAIDRAENTMPSGQDSIHYASHNISRNASQAAVTSVWQLRRTQESVADGAVFLNLWQLSFTEQWLLFLLLLLQQAS